MGKTKIYSDNGNVVVMTNDPDAIKKIEEIFPDEYRRKKNFNLSSSVSAPKPKPDPPPSPFRNGLYYGCKPSEYVKKNGINGALQIMSETDIPENMHSEIARVCAACVHDYIEKVKDDKVTKDSFIAFIRAFEPVVGENIRRILQKHSYGSIENYCADVSDQRIQMDYVEICRNILKRTSAVM